MDMFGGLTKTSSRIAIAAALGMTLGGFAMSASPAKAADLGGDCCADLEERVAELEATTVRKGNKKVSVTLSGWVVKLGEWWDDGHEQNFYVGDKHTTLSSHFQISGSAQISPGWSGGYTIAVETRGGSAVGDNNQFNDNVANGNVIDIVGNISVLLSYMWIKSDKYGTINWGQLSQATDNVALLPDLSGTVIESNAVLFDGQGYFVRPKGARNSNDLSSDFTWGAVVNCLSGGGGIGADCNGYPDNAFRYDTPTWGGFSASTSYGEDDMWDVALKYAADWNSVKFSAAAGFTQLTDEGCFTAGSPSIQAGCGLALQGGGGAPFQDYRRDAQIFQIGASIMHVPTGLFVYGLWQREENDGTQWKELVLNKNNIFESKFANSDANENDVWFVKAGIKRAWTPAGATVLFGEWGQYNDQFTGLCGNPFGDDGNACIVNVPTAINADGTAFTTATSVNDSEVTRWGVGVVQEIDSAAMHLFARWQHLELDLSGVAAFTDPVTGDRFTNGKKVNFSSDDLDLFQIGGVIFF
jgi:Gram-negative porin